MRHLLNPLLAVVVSVLSASLAYAGGDTALTYQGRLLEAGEPANGMFNVDFSLWDDPAAGIQVGATITFNSLPITDGLFTVQLDFGAAAFDNTDRWLEIVVNATTLTPRQPITRTPYSIQTRGIIVDANQNVGVGTTTPAYPLEVVSDRSRTINARNTATSGASDGVWGSTASNSGWGVFGFASAASGSTNGTRGQSLSTSGTGVLGLANAGSGSTIGVSGQSTSPDGTGVLGVHSASSGTAPGVLGHTNSTSVNAVGVHGRINSTSPGGFSAGVRGENLGKGFTGIGVWGSQNGSGWGVYGTTGSGAGVFGRATVDVETAAGVWGEGVRRGVYGRATASSGFATGVFGESHSIHGRGMWGHATSSTGLTFGVFGISESTAGQAVRGSAYATSGSTFGVYGTSFSSEGTGVKGHAQGNGATIGVEGSANGGGWDFYASGAGGNYGAASSIRWKSNVRNIDQPLDKIAGLRGVYFDWDADHGGHHDVGMIAEEVGEVLPEIVNYEENGIDAMGMDYSKLTPLLVEAVNALHRDVEHKDLQIMELQDRLNALETLVEQLALQIQGGAK
ncbi:MAG: tail fiber domain-containing protein [Planctomycetes bacterium]|nr:tail fiber domain-containing protein [Planctomycetota bacterium]